jgi:hypothetical protein
LGGRTLKLKRRMFGLVTLSLSLLVKFRWAPVPNSKKRLCPQTRAEVIRDGFSWRYKSAVMPENKGKASQ